jgi:phospholipase A1
LDRAAKVGRLGAVVLGCAAALLPSLATAAADPSEIAACRAVPDPAERAYCYDRLFGTPGDPAPAAPGADLDATAAPAGEPPVITSPDGTGAAGAAGAPAPAATPASKAGATVEAEPAADAAGLARDAVDFDEANAPHTDLAIRWELDRGTNRGLWLPRGHERTYILPVRWSTDVNEQPSSPTQPVPVGDGPFDSLEGKFQLSLKLKALDDVLGGRTDVWIGYTQQSHWQVYNREISRPFRETNYEPEVFATVPLKFEVLGLTNRMLNVGVVHQSNGQSDPRSRSWNRVYAQLGLERGPYTLLVKPWVRLAERDRVDNNPDISDYVGRGELQAIWSKGDHTVSLRVRNSFRDSWRGSAQLDWSFPMYGNLKGYLQVFNGYGESLIDYNHSQTTIGLGVLVIDVL